MLYATIHIHDQEQQYPKFECPYTDTTVGSPPYFTLRLARDVSMFLPVERLESLSETIQEALHKYYDDRDAKTTTEGDPVTAEEPLQ